MLQKTQSSKSGTCNVSKYPRQWQGVLDTLIIILEDWNFIHSSGIKCQNNHEVKDDPCPPCLWSGTINILQVTDDDKGVLDTLLIMLEIWNFAHRSKMQCQEQLLNQGLPMSSMFPVRNTQCPPRHWWWQEVLDTLTRTLTLNPNALLILITQS